jgi:ABC-type polysaccharide/polyol phosphate transport system ATPase subunit
MADMIGSEDSTTHLPKTRDLELTEGLGDTIAISDNAGSFEYLIRPRSSSGMYERLAFAVAAHLEPEILIVDEVLAGGDDAFQKQC